MIGDDLFERARGADLVQLAAPIKLFRAGRRFRGECPLCGASKGKRAAGAFWVDPEIGRWGCFAGGSLCSKGGDAIDLERALRGGSAREAAERLVSAPMDFKRPATVTPKPDVRPDEDGWKLGVAATLWRRAERAVGSPVETYLRHRGISGWPLEQALRRLRFHPAAYHSGPPGAPVLLPAMVGIVHAPGGATGGVHVTYLAPDGRGKTWREPAKRMWGPQGKDGSPGCVWLTPVGSSPKLLLVGEGIESVLSAACLLGEPVRMAAALSLRALQGHWLADRFGRVDPACVSADPETPAFVWPTPEASPWTAVAIAVDRDMKPLRRIRTRKATGGTCEIEMCGETRAKICASLAEQAWRRACPDLPALAVRAIAPSAGRDFNDELMARMGEGAAA